MCVFNDLLLASRNFATSRWINRKLIVRLNVCDRALKQLASHSPFIWNDYHWWLMSYWCSNPSRYDEGSVVIKFSARGIFNSNFYNSSIPSFRPCIQSVISTEIIAHGRPQCYGIFRVWISNNVFINHLHVITYPCSDLKVRMIFNSKFYNSVIPAFRPCIQIGISTEIIAHGLP